MMRLSVAALLALGLAASAQVNNDFRPATGVYSTVANWTLNKLPASNDVVRFGVGCVGLNGSQDMLFKLGMLFTHDF